MVVWLGGFIDATEGFGLWSVSWKTSQAVFGVRIFEVWYYDISQKRRCVQGGLILLAVSQGKAINTQK